MTVTVIIVTLKRPDHVRRCLQCLREQTRPAEQVIVVDASPDDLTRKVVEEFADVMYLRNDNGIGRMTASRNIGVLHSTGSIIAFVDDDGYATPNWLENLLRAYDDESIGAVGGRVLQNGAVARQWDPDKVGKVLSSGVLYAGFDSDPGKMLYVDHIMGCNMSFRREVIAQLGGFREDYPGISGICEDSDMSLRVRKAGWKIAFVPDAVVDHVAAPQVRGRRFDARYSFYSGHNSVILLIRNRGLFAPVVVRYVATYGWEATVDGVRQAGAAIVRAGAYVTGLCFGLLHGAAYAIRHGTDPLRHDEAAEKLRRTLETQPEEPVPARAR
jgi:GT2 family glycosyltransferase